MVSVSLARPGRDLASQPAKKWASESENSSTNPATLQQRTLPGNR